MGNSKECQAAQIIFGLSRILQKVYPALWFNQQAPDRPPQEAQSIHLDSATPTLF
jgi:hypothetical protein